jgi:hypothetical protein
MRDFLKKTQIIEQHKGGRSYSKTHCKYDRNPGAFYAGSGYPAAVHTGGLFGG